MAAEQELKLKAIFEGGDQAAAGVRRITEEERNLAQAVLDSADASDEARASAVRVLEAYKQQDEAAKKSTVSFSEFRVVLDRISPGLGAFADGLLKAANIAGDATTQNLKLTDVLAKGRTAILENVGALKLLGAGALVTVAIRALTHAFQEMWREGERVAQVLRDQVSAFNELKSAQREAGDEIVNLRAASRQGPFTGEQATAARQTFNEITTDPQFSFIAPEAIQRAINITGGARGKVGGGSASQEEIALFARLIELGKVQNLETAGPASVGTSLSAFSGLLAVDVPRARAEKLESLRRALIQSKAIGGETLDLQDVVRSVAQPGVDVDSVINVIQRGKFNFLERAFTDRPLVLEAEKNPGFAETVESVERILKKVESLIPQEPTRVNQTINYYQQNSRFIGSDSESQKRRIRNGENRKFVREEG